MTGLSADLFSASERICQNKQQRAATWLTVLYFVQQYSYTFYAVKDDRGWP